MLAIVLVTLLARNAGEGEAAVQGLARAAGSVPVEAPASPESLETLPLDSRTDVTSADEPSAAVSEVAELDTPDELLEPGRSEEPGDGISVELVFSASFVDSESNPVSGVEAWVAGLEQAIGTSDATGQLVETVSLSTELARSAWQRLELHYWATGFAGGERRVERRIPMTHASLGQVVLEPGNVVRGRVLTEAGEPVPGAFVEWCFVEEPEGGGLPSREAESRIYISPAFPLKVETDEEGRFAIRGVPLGFGFVRAWADGKRRGRADAMRLAAGPSPEVEIRLPSLRPGIAGTVFGPEGNPVAKARVALYTGAPLELVPRGRGSSSRAALNQRTTTDERGHFKFDFVAVDGPFSLSAIPPEPVAYPGAVSGVLGGDQAVELFLKPPAWLEVAILGRGGKPIPWSHARLSGREPGLAGGLLPAGREGVLRVLRPQGEFRIQAFAPGYRSKRTKSLDPAHLGERLDLTLSEGGAIAGRVLCEGAPVAGAAIVLNRTHRAEEVAWARDITDRERPFTVLGDAKLQPQSATTDAEGRFLASIHGDGRYVVLVRAPGFPPTVFDAGDIASDAPAVALDFNLFRSGALEGEVFVAEGDPREGVRVGVSSGWGIAHTTLTDAAGRYAFSDLAPGSYQVRECPLAQGGLVDLKPSGGSATSEVDWDCEVASGRTTRFDLNLRRGEECRVRGCIRMDAALLEPWSLSVLPAGWDGGSWGSWTTTDDSGCFEMALSTSGTRQIRAQSGVWAALQDIEIAAGNVEWSPVIEVGSLAIAGVFTDSNGRPTLARLQTTTASGATVRQRVVLPYGLEEESTLFEEVPAGQIEVLVPTSDGQRHTGWSKIADVFVPPGGKAEIELP